MITSKPTEIALIGYSGIQTLDLAGPFEVFAMANLHRGGTAYRLTLAAPEGGEIASNSGLRIGGFTSLAALPEGLDTIILCGGSEEGLQRLMRTDGFLDWLRDRAGRTRRTCSVCTGAFVLAAAGLLDGRRATTHWASCERMRSFRPQVQLEPDAIFVADPPLYTSAGITAGIDLCLFLVESDYGPDLARAVARNLVLFMRRAGGQSQFNPGLDVQVAASPRLRGLIAEISADPTGDLGVEKLAERAGMAERSFSRAFRRQTGVTPAAFVEMARLNRAKALLETADWSLPRVAERAGFGSLAALHRAFQRRLRTTPGEYRERFGRPAA